MAVMICPHCERGQVQPQDPTLTRCSACGRAPEVWVLEILEEITCLPNALGSHACEECGHPQMTRLPDGTFRCPGCGAEILSLDATFAFWDFREKTEAYRRGWLDGYFLREASNFYCGTQLIRWEVDSERTDYYEGHHAGSRQRLLLLEQAGFTGRRCV